MTFVAMGTPPTQQANPTKCESKERDFHVRHWNSSRQVARNMKSPQRARRSQGPQDTRLHFYQRNYGTTSAAATRPMSRLPRGYGLQRDRQGYTDRGQMRRLQVPVLSWKTPQGKPAPRTGDEKPTVPVHNVYQKLHGCITY